jgi:hypothetical protein
MEVVIPPQRLEPTLHVLMNQRGYPLAAFDWKEIAREYLDIQLPTLEVIEPESFASLHPPLTHPQNLIEPPEHPIFQPLVVQKTPESLASEGFF